MKIQIGDRKLWISWRHINPKFGKKYREELIPPPVIVFRENGTVPGRKINDNAYGTQCSIYDDTPLTDRPPIHYAGETTEVPDETEAEALLRSKKSGPIAKGRSILHRDDIKRYSKEIGRQQSLKKAMKAAGFTKTERLEIWQNYHARPRFDQPKSTTRQSLINQIDIMEEKLDKALKANNSVVRVEPDDIVIVKDRDVESLTAQEIIKEPEFLLVPCEKPAHKKTTIWDSLFSFFK